MLAVGHLVGRGARDVGEPGGTEAGMEPLADLADPGWRVTPWFRSCPLPTSPGFAGRGVRFPSREAGGVRGGQTGSCRRESVPVFVQHPEERPAVSLSKERSPG